MASVVSVVTASSCAAAGSDAFAVSAVLTVFFVVASNCVVVCASTVVAPICVDLPLLKVQPGVLHIKLSWPCCRYVLTSGNLPKARPMAGLSLAANAARRLAITLS